MANIQSYGKKTFPLSKRRLPDKQNKASQELDEVETGDPVSFQLEPLTLQARYIVLYGDITEATCAEIVQQLLFIKNMDDQREDKDAPLEPIKIWISSSGGSVADMFAVYDIIDRMKPLYTIKTYGIGKIMSAAVLLLSAGSPGERYIGKRARMMLHPPTLGTYGSAHDIEIDNKELKKMKDLYLEELVVNSRITKRKALALLKDRDHYFSAEQAIEWGLVDKIL